MVQRENGYGEVSAHGPTLCFMTIEAAPIQGLSGAEAAKILGVRSELYVYKHVAQGVIPKARKHARSDLDRDDVEQVALARYRPGHPYWINTTEAAAVLGLSRQRVNQLAGEGRLPSSSTTGTGSTAATSSRSSPTPAALADA